MKLPTRLLPLIAALTLTATPVLAAPKLGLERYQEPTTTQTSASVYQHTWTHIPASGGEYGDLALAVRDGAIIIGFAGNGAAAYVEDLEAILASRAVPRTLREKYVTFLVIHPDSRQVGFANPQSLKRAFEAASSGRSIAGIKNVIVGNYTQFLDNSRATGLLTKDERRLLDSLQGVAALGRMADGLGGQTSFVMIGSLHSNVAIVASGAHGIMVSLTGMHHLREVGMLEVGAGMPVLTSE